MNMIEVPSTEPVDGAGVENQIDRPISNPGPDDACQGNGGVDGSPDALPRHQPHHDGENTADLAPLGACEQPIQPISKSQLKKIEKRKRQEEKKKEKKELERAQRKEHMEQKRRRIQETVSSMTDEELQRWRQERAAKVDLRSKENNERKARVKQAMESGQRLVIDLEFPDLMNDNEKKSICQQVTYCYAANTRAVNPCHLILTGVQGSLRDLLNHQSSGFEKWLVTSTEKPYIEYFDSNENNSAGVDDVQQEVREEEEEEEGKYQQHRHQRPVTKDALVYLTADSPNELQELDPSKVYIIGGIVDRNRYKNLCFNKAIEQGISSARLPLDKCIKLASSPVMCTNHVVEIILKWMELRDWEAAFKAVIPSRKRK